MTNRVLSWKVSTLSDALHAVEAYGDGQEHLNGGPGAPAFIHVRPDIVEEIEPALAGWLSHDAPFAMERSYRPALSTERFRVVTPPVVQLAILDRALDVWDGVDMTDIRAASVALTELFITEVEARCPGLALASPRNPGGRGSQVSFAFEHGYPAMQALIDRGVIGDFRAPDIMRFGFTPLYVDEANVLAAAETLETVIGEELWRDPKYQTRLRVMQGACEVTTVNCSRVSFRLPDGMSPGCISATTNASRQAIPSPLLHRPTRISGYADPHRNLSTTLSAHLEAAEGRETRFPPTRCESPASRGRFRNSGLSCSSGHSQHPQETSGINLPPERRKIV